MKDKFTRREFITALGASAAMAFAPRTFARNSNNRLNVLLITADDMNFDSLGVTGCRVPDITPNLDALAAQGMRFTQAHVTSAICQPSRSALMTGRFPHRNGALGFQPINENVSSLQEYLRKAGYFNGIMAKIEHLTPKWKFCWDVEIPAQDLGNGRDPEAYYVKSKSFFEQAKAAGKPFFLMANSMDPHRPFPGAETVSKVSRTYKPKEITVPPFLPGDLPDVRKELAQYYTAVHRCDETVGQILRALKETGFEENTIVFFLSDNGISEPFAKTNCYYTSTATPLIVRWPGKIKPGTVNDKDLVSGVDFMPTVLDALALDQVEGLDGRSFVPLLEGKHSSRWDKVFTFITSTSAGNMFPMRCVRTKNFSYIFNAWSDGKTTFKNEPMGGLAFKAMAQSSDQKIAERVKFFLYRTPEELYDIRKDPWEQKNLIAEKDYKNTLSKFRLELLRMMERTGDPLLDVFKARIGKD